MNHQADGVVMNHCNYHSEKVTVFLVNRKLNGKKIQFGTESLNLGHHFFLLLYGRPTEAVLEIPQWKAYAKTVK